MIELGLTAIGTVLGWASGRPRRPGAKLGLCAASAGALAVGADALVGLGGAALMPLSVIVGVSCRSALDAVLDAQVKKGVRI